MEEIEADMRTTYNKESRTVNLSKKRVSDFVTNSKVILPGPIDKTKVVELQLRKQRAVEATRRYK